MRSTGWRRYWSSNVMLLTPTRDVRHLMRIGLQIPSFSWPGGPAQIGPTFAGIARDADQAGLASLWVMDHFWQIGMVGPPEEPMLECYSALSYAAAVTERITLGGMVTGAVYRHPGVL